MMTIKQIAANRTAIARPAGNRLRLPAQRFVVKVNAFEEQKQQAANAAEKVTDAANAAKDSLPQASVPTPQPTGAQGKAPASPNWQQFQVSDQNPKGGVAAGEAAGPGSQTGVRFLWEQEVINGRAAMLGFVAAVISELSTHKSVVEQVFGARSGDTFAQQSAPIWASVQGFFAIVFIVTLATAAPRYRENLAFDSISFGPFTPKLERIVGWTAMLGFFGLVTTELIKGSAVF